MRLLSTLLAVGIGLWAYDRHRHTQKIEAIILCETSEQELAERYRQAMRKLSDLPVTAQVRRRLMRDYLGRGVLRAVTEAHRTVYGNPTGARPPASQQPSEARE